jgi:hypothetical protein
MFKIAAIGALVIFGAAAAASAGTVDFNYNSVAYSNTATNNSSGVGAAASAVQTYMDSALAAAGCTGCTVTVYGGVADKHYDGDGHVVGPDGKPLTLGSYNGAPSAISNTATPTATLGTSNNWISGSTGEFLADTNDNATQVGVGSKNEIYMKFNFPITGTISFDYEIFPCAAGFEGCTSTPDLTFEAGNNTNGSDPTIATFTSVKPSASAADGSSTQSADGTNETAPQYIGYYSTTVNGVTELDFLDWPATIGIDNLTFNVPTPEPNSMILLGMGIVALFVMRKKMQPRRGTSAQ